MAEDSTAAVDEEIVLMNQSFENIKHNLDRLEHSWDQFDRRLDRIDRKLDQDFDLIMKTLKNLQIGIEDENSLEEMNPNDSHSLSDFVFGYTEQRDELLFKETMNLSVEDLHPYVEKSVSELSTMCNDDQKLEPECEEANDPEVFDKMPKSHSCTTDEENDAGLLFYEISETVFVEGNEVSVLEEPLADEPSNVFTAAGVYIIFSYGSNFGRHICITQQIQQSIHFEDIHQAISKVSDLSDDNRSGTDYIPHRISPSGNRTLQIIGFTCRVGLAVFGSPESMHDLVTKTTIIGEIYSNLVQLYRLYFYEFPFGKTFICIFDPGGDGYLSMDWIVNYIVSKMSMLVGSMAAKVLQMYVSIGVSHTGVDHFQLVQQPSKSEFEDPSPKHEESYDIITFAVVIGFDVLNIAWSVPWVVSYINLIQWQYQSADGTQMRSAFSCHGAFVSCCIAAIDGYFLTFYGIEVDQPLCGFGFDKLVPSSLSSLLIIDDHLRSLFKVITDSLEMGDVWIRHFRINGKMSFVKYHVFLECMHIVEDRAREIVVRQGGEGQCFYVIGSTEFEYQIKSQGHRIWYKDYHWLLDLVNDKKSESLIWDSRLIICYNFIIRDNAASTMVGWYTTKFYETMSDHIDSLAIQHNIIELLTGFKQFVISPSINSSRSSLTLASSFPYAKNILSLQRRVQEREWRHICIEMEAHLLEVLTTIEDLVKKAKDLLYDHLACLSEFDTEPSVDILLDGVDEGLISALVLLRAKGETYQGLGLPAACGAGVASSLWC